MYNELIKAAKRSGKTGEKLHNVKPDMFSVSADTHPDCLTRLMETMEKLGKIHFPDQSRMLNIPKIWEIIKMDAKKRRLLGEFDRVYYKNGLNVNNPDEEPFAIMGEIFQSKKLFSHAFICYMISADRSIQQFGILEAGDSQIKKALALRQEVQSSRCGTVFEMFSPGFQSMLGNHGMTVLQYLNCTLDKMQAQYYAARNTNEQVVLDLEIHHLRKRIQYRDYIDLSELLFKILKTACKAMTPKLKRFRQARLMISVVNELMKECDTKNSVPFKYLCEAFVLVKCCYWGMILAFTELRDVFITILEGTDDQVEEMFTFRDESIDLGVELTEEDEQLPVILMDTEEEKSAIHKQIEKFKRKMKKSAIPELRELYTDIRRIEVNYFIPQPDPFIHYRTFKEERK